MFEPKLTHCFVESVPEELEPWSLYISVEFTTVMHLCLCGCGREVVTPLAPNDWKMTFDGESISLYPSIGNWSFPCRSHYWIRRNQVEWAAQWSEDEIVRGRLEDKNAKEKSSEPIEISSGKRVLHSKTLKTTKPSFWRQFLKWFDK